jgi:hypothetical protein
MHMCSSGGLTLQLAACGVDQCGEEFSSQLQFVEEVYKIVDSYRTATARKHGYQKFKKFAKLPIFTPQ